MYPFNLEQALAGYPVVTRDGEKVINIFETNENSRFNVSVLTKDDDEDYYYSVSHNWYSKEGECMMSSSISESKRLFMQDVEHKITTFEINLYKDELGNLIAGYKDNNFVVNNETINTNRPIYDFEFSARTANALKNEGILTFNDLRVKTKRELNNLVGIGKKGLLEITEILAKRCLPLSKESKLNFIKTISFTVEE